MDQPKNPVLSFLSQILFGFGFAIATISIIGFMLGNEARDVSTMYRLGGEGLPYGTMLQFFLCVATLQILRIVIFSKAIFKEMLLLWRAVLMIAAGMLTAGAFAVGFGWIPIDRGSAWLSFILSYGICTGVGTAIMLITTKRKDKQYNKLLSQYKEKQQKESGE